MSKKKGEYLPAGAGSEEEGSRSSSRVSSPSITMAMTEPLYSGVSCSSVSASYVSLPQRKDQIEV